MRSAKEIRRDILKIAMGLENDGDGSEKLPDALQIQLDAKDKFKQVSERIRSKKRSKDNCGVGGKKARTARAIRNEIRKIAEDLGRDDNSNFSAETTPKPLVLARTMLDFAKTVMSAKLKRDIEVLAIRIQYAYHDGAPRSARPDMDD